MQQAVTQQDYSVTSAVLAVSVFSLATVALSWLNSRSARSRPLTHGTPIVIVQDGEPIRATMRAERVSIDDLIAAARNDGIDKMSDIRLAVLETNGRMSFFTGDTHAGSPETPPVG